MNVLDALKNVRLWGISAMPTTYYMLHGGRLTVAEYWRIAPDLFSFGLCVFVKPFGGMPFNFSIPRIEKILEVEWDDLPPVVTRQFKGPVQGFEAAGFDYLFAYELPVLERTRLGAAAVLLSKDALTVATVNYCQDPNTRMRQINCVAVFDDDTKGVTTSMKQMMNSMPEYRTHRHPTAANDPEELYELHQKHLEDWADESLNPQRLDGAAVRKHILEGEQRHVDFNIERRVYIPMQKAEIRRLRDENDD